MKNLMPCLEWCYILKDPFEEELEYLVKAIPECAKAATITQGWTRFLLSLPSRPFDGALLSLLPPAPSSLENWLSYNIFAQNFTNLPTELPEGWSYSGIISSLNECRLIPRIKAPFQFLIFNLSEENLDEIFEGIQWLRTCKIKVEFATIKVLQKEKFSEEFWEKLEAHLRREYHKAYYYDASRDAVFNRREYLPMKALRRSQVFIRKYVPNTYENVVQFKNELFDGSDVKICEYGDFFAKLEYFLENDFVRPEDCPVTTIEEAAEGIDAYLEHKPDKVEEEANQLRLARLIDKIIAEDIPDEETIAAFKIKSNQNRA